MVLSFVWLPCKAALRTTVSELSSVGICAMDQSTSNLNMNSDVEIGSAVSTRQGSTDCSSFFATTVTPAAVYIFFIPHHKLQANSTTPSTTTATTVTTVTITYNGLPAKKRDLAPAIAARQVTVIPSSVPAYASACSGTIGYSSACSCIGATHATTTVAPPTSTTTISKTTFVTECEYPLPTFILKVTHSRIVINGKSIDGTYGQLDDGDGPLIGFNGSPRSQAVVLSLNAAGNLFIDELMVAAGTNGPPGQAKLIHFDTPPVQYDVLVLCSVGGGVLKCTNDGCDPNGNNGCQYGVNILQLCPPLATTNDLWIGAEVNAPCVSATFNVIPVCTPPKK